MKESERPLQPAGESADGEAEVLIDEANHPVARRVTDVLRASRGNQRTFLIDDAENIAQALRCGVHLDSVYCTVGRESVRESLRAEDGTEVPFYVLAADVATALFGAERRSRVFALARTPPLSTLDDLTGRSGDIVVLDGVRLVGNIGAVTRSACAFDAAGVVLLDSGLTSPTDRRLVRASRGMIFAMPVIVTNAEQMGQYLARHNIPLASLSTRATTPLSTAKRVDRRLALLMGSERRGASESMTDSATLHFHVPMSPVVESLNISVATGIALYERRHRRSARQAWCTQRETSRPMSFAGRAE